MVDGLSVELQDPDLQPEGARRQPGQEGCSEGRSTLPGQVGGDVEAHFEEAANQRAQLVQSEMLP